MRTKVSLKRGVDPDTQHLATLLVEVFNPYGSPNPRVFHRQLTEALDKTRQTLGKEDLVLAVKDVQIASPDLHTLVARVDGEIVSAKIAQETPYSLV